LPLYVSVYAYYRSNRQKVPQGRGASPEVEENQGEALVDAALQNDVKYIVYSSVDRGGEKRSWENPTSVPHFKSKHTVELYLRDKAAGAALMWTILRLAALWK
jgi:hypothetical protein